MSQSVVLCVGVRAWVGVCVCGLCVCVLARAAKASASLMRVAVGSLNAGSS